VWVWLAFAEVPSLPTCVGGLIVMMAIVGEVLSVNSLRSCGRTALIDG